METVTCDLASWIEAGPDAQREFRQAVHLILTAITLDGELRDIMVMKGGLLLAIRYQSGRFTKDLDFSTSKTGKDLDYDELRMALERNLAMAVADSDYDLDCRIQRCRVNPPNEDAQFPNIELTVGYAYKGTPKHKRLLQKQSPTTIEIDFNLNEPILGVESLMLGEGAALRAYSCSDLVAEKLRSLMQQEVRNRYRRQDIYDLRMLLENGITEEGKEEILRSLMKKARARGIEPTPDSLAAPEIRRRAARDYQTLADEIEGELPNFDQSYGVVEAFYRALPWATLQGEAP